MWGERVCYPLGGPVSGEPVITVRNGTRTRLGAVPDARTRIRLLTRGNRSLRTSRPLIGPPGAGR